MVLTAKPKETAATPAERLNFRETILLGPNSVASALRLLMLAFSSTLLPLVISSIALADDQVDYLNQVKPILRGRCYACHGALKQEAGLRLDTVQSAHKGGDSGPALEPGNAASSLILKRVAAVDEARMPPHHEGEPLTESQISLLKSWIDAGGLGPADEQPEADPHQHWAFQPITRPAVPATQNDWGHNPLDAFLQQHHQRLGIQPLPEAPRIVLLRRLYFDLIGLPPTLEEIAACEADPSPQWYEQTVMRLLEDPRHGERWARHWMDIWRYSDWWGLGDQLRNSQKHIWHWRDWIVESLNEDLPYDEMVRLMLAADEMHPNDLTKLRATGYLARNYVLFNRPQWMEETVEHVSKGFLGLTMNCVRCHAHKYDPFEQADYYRLRAFFEPYHVRLDVVPGETDLAQNGIPRVYDGLLEEPTYLYIRGDERTPDKSQVISPGVPSFLDFNDLKVEPVVLPIEAWQPERRPWVVEAYLSAAQRRVQSANEALTKAEAKVVEALQREDLAKQRAEEVQPNANNATELAPIIADSFETLDSARWKLLGGKWLHQPGRLEQQLDGATRSALRMLDKPPRDFEVTLRFSTLGGSQWRSVGVAFDVTQEDPTQQPAPSDTEQLVYVSAFAGGAKIQAAVQSGGQWQYPGGNAMRPMSINLQQEYTLRLQVRGQLINASLNGQPLLAWESTVPRRDGALQFITFDALAIFHEVSVSALDAAVVLHQPGAITLEMLQKSVKEARAEQTVVKEALTVAEAELDSARCRAAAQRDEWNTPDRPNQDLKNAAVRAERLAKAARSRHSLAVATLALERATTDTRESAEKAVKEASESLEKDLQASEAEVAASDQYVKFSGAMWTPTRFLNSGSDDPPVKFPAQSTGRRTALAQWITDRRNPLTARVAANHIWTRHMGQPLVPTVFDFGRNGATPQHPELLDWLASELIDSGWSMKHLHSLIVTSAAYRLSSSVKSDLQLGSKATQADSENLYWWRRMPIRLESQLLRDALLSLSDKLDSRLGGPSIPVDQQDASLRRSLYFFHSNNERNLFLSTFDEALVRDCYRREQSIVPQQALALSNSALAWNAAEQIAKRLGQQSADDETFVRNAFRLITGINPSVDEVAVSIGALESWRSMGNGSAEGARENLVWALINHNDFVTLR
jgi:Protein of unknown function (DUF1553)/Protein of unknown function (DUF1549)/Planctomycete cytochrome C